jgi:hypothetical protein
MPILTALLSFAMFASFRRSGAPAPTGYLRPASTCRLRAQERDALARYTETIAVDKPFADTWRAIHAALVAHNWNIVNVRDNTFYVRERLSFETMLWRNACRFAIHVAGDGETRANVHLFGATLGFGPLPKGRLRRVVEILKGQLLGMIARIEPTPSA